MQSAEQYRLYGEECLALAERANAADRPMLLEIAAAWLKLAESAIVNKRDRGGEAESRVPR